MHWKKGARQSEIFVKSNTYMIKMCLCVLAIMDAIIVFLGFINSNIYRSMLIIGFITAIGLLCSALCWREGVIIDNDKLCYRWFKKRVYNIKDIERIHIAAAQICLGYNVFDSKPNNIFIRWLNGNYHYKIIYLKSKNVKLYKNDDGNMDFRQNHKKDVLFETEYDERIVSYLKSKGVLVTGKNI